jgi:GR25 family glycosyltransferase involved in LPS biosynthesis
MINQDYSIGAIVIALKESQSGLRLKDLLNHMIYAEILEAMTPEFLKKAKPKKKSLSKIEISISYSHHLARERGLILKKDWILILEEDAIIEFKKEELLSFIQIVEKNFTSKKIPIGIHLFPEQFGILVGNRKNNLLRIKYLPDYAVGYILNQAAIKTSVESFRKEKIEVADWPISMRSEITWVCPDRSFVKHPDLNDTNTRSSTKLIRLRNSNRHRITRYLNRKTIPLIIIKIGHLLNLNFGINPIESEKIRSIKITY